eukprot:16431588-Heterocapsa_arctica.AAC.1
MTAGAAKETTTFKASANVDADVELLGGGGSVDVGYKAATQNDPIVANIKFDGNLPLKAAEVRSKHVHEVL